MYLDFFGLRENPFNVTPDPRFLFFTPRHQEALDNLLYGIEERKGFLVLTGEVGSGKTTLCRALLNRLPAHVRTALVLNPALSDTQLLRAILDDLGAPPAGRDRLALIAQLNDFLLTQVRRGENVVVIIDEAQDLKPGLLEQIRLLSNLETDQRKLLQIVLAGQPELDRRLSRPELRQLRQRVMIRCALQPLDAGEVRAYIEHRLRVAGAADGVGFDEPAVRVIHGASKGIPRLINKLSDRAMLAAYAAGRRLVAREDARRAWSELEALL